jgi:hypothetical protein
MEIRAVRIGERYGPEYEDYLKSKLPNIQFLNEEKDNLLLQWNKLHFFNLDIDKPVCVIDIDISLINDYMEIFNYPIQPGEFLSIRQWWDPNSKSELNGGFYKFYPKDTKYIYDKMMENPTYWMNYFIKNGAKPGPINGEENFVEMMVKQKLDLKFIPDEWCCRMKEDKKFLSKQNRLSSLDYVYLGGFNPSIKLVHYNGLNNFSKDI